MLKSKSCFTSPTLWVVSLIMLMSSALRFASKIASSFIVIFFCFAILHTSQSWVEDSVKREAQHGKPKSGNH